MENIWGFLLQTLSVSVVAAILLLLKKIFEDKLSPRWQYGIWGLLALRILWPIHVSRYIILPWPMWVETMKAWVEGGLNSSYAQPYTPVAVHHILPNLQGVPRSITDVLFLVYTMGVGIVLVWYGFHYVRLCHLIRKGTPGDVQLVAQIQTVAWRHQLEVCPVVTLHGLSSAFVCGVFRPVLVVPADRALDDKVVLHELLHLKNRDSLQSIIWCVLRALHWCNPFLQYIFYRILSDMESLCDQRVLERLEGEERREYGTILLEMANERYASMPGTTSISNGGKNIARRIAAIVRFKRYPQGMALVSVCIAILLFSPLFMGVKASYGAEIYEPGPLRKLEQSMAVSRLNRCSTVAGALDTYAKGLALENGVYIATASPLSMQQEFIAQMEQSSREESWAAYHLAMGMELEYVDRTSGYRVWNITENEDGSYGAWLVLAVKYVEGTESETLYLEDLAQSKKRRNASVVIPVRVWQENGDWVVEETGQRICSPRYFEDCSSGHYSGAGYSPVPALQEYELTGEWGTLLLERSVEYQVDNYKPTQSFWGSVTSFDYQIKTDAIFEQSTPWIFSKYSYLDPTGTSGPEGSFGWVIESQKEDGTWEPISDTYQALYQDWDGEEQRGHARGLYLPDQVPVELPQVYRAEVVWHGSVVGEGVMQEVTHEAE